VLIGWMLDASPLKAKRSIRTRVGAFGFSSGGFTVLAAAGGEPDMSQGPGALPSPSAELRLQADRHRIRSRPSVLTAQWVHDPRIKAVVSAAPAWVTPSARTG
jgi:predicted dienelactone hydrolase